VERIVDEKTVTKYCVKWKGYPASANTWEEEDVLKDCKELVEAYKKKKEGGGEDDDNVEDDVEEGEEKGEKEEDGGEDGGEEEEEEEKNV